MFRRLVQKAWLSNSIPAIKFNHFQYHHLTLSHNRYISIKLNESLQKNTAKEINNKIEAVYNELGYDGLLNLANDSFNDQDFNITALCYEKLIKSHQENSAYFTTKSKEEIYEIYYKFICTLQLLKDYDSAKYYIEDVILPYFGDDFDGSLYGIYGLIQKDGFNDIKSAEINFEKSILLKPGISNLFSYFNLYAILFNKDDVDWDNLYSFSSEMLSFASFDAYIMSQHGITCTALNKWDEAEKCFHASLEIYSKHYQKKDDSAKELEDETHFVSYFPDLSHISLRCLLQILCQHWFDSTMNDKIISIHELIEHKYYKQNVWICKFLLQFIAPIVSETYWLRMDNKSKAIQCIFENDLLLQQNEYNESLKYIHAFRYWLDLSNVSKNCVDILQTEEMSPFYFGCCSVINSLFEHRIGALNSCKFAFDAIAKEKVQPIDAQIEAYKKEGVDVENKTNMLIFNYVHKLMEQIFVDTLNKIAKIAWGNVSLYKFETAKEIAMDILNKFDAENVIANGILCRIYAEQKKYAKAIKIFEEKVTEQKCALDDMIYFNLMPYYAISLCFEGRMDEGNDIFDRLLGKIKNEDSEIPIHSIHKEQVYRWYAYKMQYVEKDFERAIEFYEKSFEQSEMMKYPPVQLEIAKCYFEMNEIEKAQINLDEAFANGKDVFKDYVTKEHELLTQKIQSAKCK